MSLGNKDPGSLRNQEYRNQLIERIQELRKDRPGDPEIKEIEDRLWPTAEKKCQKDVQENPSEKGLDHTEEIAALLKEAVSRYNIESMGIIRALNSEILGHKRHIERLQEKARYVQMLETK